MLKFKIKKKVLCEGSFVGLRLKCNAGRFIIISYNHSTQRYRRSELNDYYKTFLGNDYSYEDINKLMFKGQWIIDN